MTTRKFYSTIISFEVLSEEPIPTSMSITDIVNEGIDGGYSLGSPEFAQKELDGKKAADALLEQGSEPQFFRIDNEGNDV